LPKNNQGDKDSFGQFDTERRLDEQHITIDEAPEQSYLEETSAEFSHPIEQDNRDNQVQHVYGWIALALSIISFFFLPFLFAVSGIIVGVIARNRQSSALGYSAIIIGIISLIVNLFLIPFS